MPRPSFIVGARVRISEDAPAFGGLEGEVAVSRESVSDVRLDAGKTVPVQTGFLLRGRCCGIRWEHGALTSARPCEDCPDAADE